MKKEVFLIAISASIALAADKAIDLNIINANNLGGITGAGVNVGVVDGPANRDHPSLIGKIEDQIFSNYNGKPYEPDYTIDTHGSHVTSIIVGNPTSSVKGLAYNAKSYNVQISGQNIGSGKLEMPKGVYDYFANHSVIAINNSVNSNIYPLINMQGIDYYEAYKGNSPSYWLGQIYTNGVTSDLARLSQENKSVIVFAAGNEGIGSPGILATARSYDESLNTWITVGAIDTEYMTNTDGSIKMKATYLPGFSNGFIGASNYAILAPGQDVVGANAAYMVKPDFGSIDKKETRLLSGTSQATPYVTAAAALVKEKFPFLKANQVADVLLSTANTNFKIPKVIVKETKNTSKIYTAVNSYYTVFYIDTPIPKDENGDIDTAKVIEDLKAEGYNSIDAKNMVKRAYSLEYYNNEIAMLAKPWVVLANLMQTA